MKRILLFLLLALTVPACKSAAEKPNTNAIWLWSKYMNEVDLQELSDKDIGNIILHEVAFTSHGVDSTVAFVQRAQEIGLKVHIWFQCFYNDGKWVSPVDDENCCFRQDYYDSLITRAKYYVDLGVDGIHLDYIRFGGTAKKHNLTDEVNSVGAVTEFCRQINAAIKPEHPQIVLSAALMPEIESQDWYGQDPAQMGRYLDVLMPMIYRYTPNYKALGEDWPVESASYFAREGYPAQVWAGTTTYDGGDEGIVKDLPAEQIFKDCRDYRNTGAAGVVLFRYGLGELPDLHGIFDEE